MSKVFPPAYCHMLAISLVDCVFGLSNVCLVTLLARYFVYTVFLELLLHLPAFLQNEVTHCHSLELDRVNTKVFLEYFVQFLCSDMVGHIKCMLEVNFSFLLLSLFFIQHSVDNFLWIAILNENL